MSSVKIEGLRKSFGAVDVLHDINLSIADGEFLALVGPSGCGKSTLLRVIAGLEEPTDGDIIIGDRVVTDMNPRERNIAMVFQSYALYPHMTVAENMAFSLKLARKSKAEIQAAVARAASILHLEEYLDRRPAQLSGGQRQRVAMGRALVRDPAVFLFDEPLSNLDAKLRVKMRAEIKSLHQTVGRTSVYVTHDQVEAMTLADRIVVMNGGRIEQQGTPLELYENPDNIFVAGFIGSPTMNFIPAEFKGGRITLPNGQNLPLDRNLGSADASIVVGIRPEHFILGEGGDVSFSGKAVLVEPTGAQTFVTFDLDCTSVTAIVDGAARIREGDIFKASVLTQSFFVFDEDGKQRRPATA